MSNQLQLRRGSALPTALFTGAVGEVTYNTDTKELVTHDGSTVGGFPIATKNGLAASSGASLVGYLPAGTSAVPTTVQAKLRESVSLLDFGCVLDDPLFDNAALIEAAMLSAMQYGVKLTGPVGEAFCSRAVVVNPATVANNVHMAIETVFVFPPGSDGLFIGGFEGANLAFAGCRTTTSSSTQSGSGVGFTKGTMRNTNLKVQRITGFQHAFKTTSDAADYFNEIRLGHITCNNTNGSCIHIATDYYSNENQVFAKFMSGWKGVTSDSLVGQPFTEFSGWKFFGIGFENITHTAFEPKSFNRCALLYPRFEGGSVPSVGWVNEDSTNSRNTYILTHDSAESLFTFGGSITTVIGRFVDAFGSTLFDRISKDGSNLVREHVSTKSVSLPYTRAYKSHLSNDMGMFERWGGYVVDGAGVLRRNGLLDPYGYHAIGAASGVVEVNPYTSFITASTTAGSTLTLKMPLRLEIEGFSLQLEISYFTSPIEIAKSTGAVTVAAGAITTTGLYSLMYRNGLWKSSKLGEKYA